MRFSDGLKYLVLRLPAQPFSGLVGEADFSPLYLHPPSRVVGICPVLGFFCFTRCVVQNLGLSEKSRGLLSVLEGSTLVIYLQIFRRRLQSCRRTWFSISTRSGLEIISWHFSFLFSCHQVLQLFQPRCPFGSLLGLSVQKGAPKISEGLLCYCKQCPGKSSPCLLLSFSCGKEVIGGIYSLHCDGFSFVAIFPLIL